MGNVLREGRLVISSMFHCLHINVEFVPVASGRVEYCTLKAFSIIVFHRHDKKRGKDVESENL